MQLKSDAKIGQICAVFVIRVQLDNYNTFVHVKTMYTNLYNYSNSLIICSRITNNISIFIINYYKYFILNHISKNYHKCIYKIRNVIQNYLF